MALEPAGVDLQAKGFQDYIRRLTAIEKAQQQAFSDSGLKDIGVSYNKAVSEAKKYEKQIKDNERAQDRLNKELKETTQSQNQFTASLKTAALAFFTKQTVQAAFELSKLGATFESQEASFQNLAASFGQSSSAILSSIIAASNGTLSRLDAIRAANEALLLGVAKTPQEFERFTRAALVLGRTVGLSASESISRFTTALGRESLLRLDDFGNKAAEVNAELARLASATLGKLPDELTKAERSALFVEAALNTSGANVDKIGDEAGDAIENFQQLEASATNLKTEFGLLLNDLNQATGLTDAIATSFDNISLAISGFRAEIGFGDTSDEIAGLQLELNQLEAQREAIARGGLEGFVLTFTSAPADKNLIDLFQEANDPSIIDNQVAAIKEQIATLEDQVKAEEDALITERESTAAIDENTDALKENENVIKALQSAVKQAEQIQLSFTRAQEDAARKLERSQSKLADKQFKEQNKLAEKQVKEREDLLQDQIDDLADFEEDRIKQIQKAEKDIAKVRESAGKDRIKQQRDIQRELRQAQERFNLSQIQSQRRFELSDKRLRAEGDILALQQLREDHSLQQKEDKENFDLSQRQNKENTNEQLKELEEQTKQQEQELQERLAELKVNLEEERGVLLQGFDNQLTELEISQAEQKQALIEAQAEQRQALLDSYAEQQEDARINKQRQLEDLGRALADERDLTAEGAMAIASELETVFGEEGVADTIFGGFTTRTESEFRTLFDSIEGIVKDAVESPTSPIFLPIIQKQGGGRNTLGGLGASSGAPASFDDGGIIPGPIGAPQMIRAHGGETVLPTHKMSLPASLSQALNVNVSGGININGAEGASSGVVDAAVEQVLDNFEIAITRMVRRHG